MPKKYRRRSTINIPGNFRGEEDIFFTKVVKGFKNFLKSPFKRGWIRWKKH